MKNTCPVVVGVFLHERSQVSFLFSELGDQLGCDDWGIDPSHECDPYFPSPLKSCCLSTRMVTRERNRSSADTNPCSPCWGRYKNKGKDKRRIKKKSKGKDSESESIIRRKTISERSQEIPKWSDIAAHWIEVVVASSPKSDDNPFDRVAASTYNDFSPSKASTTREKVEPSQASCRTISY
jgi:hypothetical protein